MKINSWLPVFFVFSVIIATTQSPVAFAGEIGGASDPDGDGIFTSDNCPNVYNPGQEDVNEDGIGDACIPPTQLVEEIIVIVEDFVDYEFENLSEGQIDSLVKKLESAVDKIESEKINGAIGSLNAAINQIEAFINSGKISSEDGQPLIEAIQSVIDVLED